MNESTQALQRQQADRLQHDGAARAQLLHAKTQGAAQQKLAERLQNSERVSKSVWARHLTPWTRYSSLSVIHGLDALHLTPMTLCDICQDFDCDRYGLGNRHYIWNRTIQILQVR